MRSSPISVTIVDDQQDRRPIRGAVYSLSDALGQIDVHALKFVFQTPSRWLKLFWLLILLVGCCASGYYIRNIVMEYRSTPTATKITTVTQLSYSYPPIVICNRFNINLTKATEANLSMETLEYAAQLLQTEDEPWGWPTPDKISKDAEALRAFMKSRNFLTYVEFYSWLSLDPNLLFYEAHGVNISASQTVFIADPAYAKPTEYRTCFRLNTVDYLPNVGEVLYLEYKIEPPEMKLGFDTDYAVIKSDWRLALEKDRIHMRTNRVTTVRLSVKKFSRMISSDGSCSGREQPDKPYSREYCRFECQMNQWRKCIGCVPLTANTSRDVPGQLLCRSTWMTIFKETCREDELTRCLQQCTPLCEYSSYDFSVSLGVINYTHFNDPRISLWIYYLVDEGLLLFEEVPTYTVESMISNIGGQLGLWTGASLLTLLEMFYVLARYCCLKYRRSSDTLRGTPSTLDDQNVMFRRPAKVTIADSRTSCLEVKTLSLMVSTPLLEDYSSNHSRRSI